MVINDLFKETYSALLTNKARSGLTILGIVIGIGSVIAMVAVGQGATSSIEESIESLGSNLIIVSPGVSLSGGISSGRGSATTLTIKDAEAIESEIDTVKAIAPTTSGRYQVTAKGTNTYTQVTGTTASYATVRNIAIETGSFFSDQNVNNYSKVAVLGPTTKEDLFGTDTEVVGRTIKISGVIFTIIGITEEKGGTTSSGDDAVYIPVTTAQRYLSGEDYVSTIYIQAGDQKSISGLQENIISLLLVRHGITNEDDADFTVTNQEDILESASSISDTLTMLLGSIAGISLIVGGIGIMNMMLTTVTERTREIGLRKAIGAKKADISKQFLSESIMLTFVGGIMGIILGLLTAIILSTFDIITTKISIGPIILAFGVSAAIGIGFGYYPAKKAASLNPIEALRYE